jgi:hypothetical protein
MKSVVVVLHFYQPPTQDPEVVRRIDRSATTLYSVCFGT